MVIPCAVQHAMMRRRHGTDDPLPLSSPAPRSVGKGIEKSLGVVSNANRLWVPFPSAA